MAKNNKRKKNKILRKARRNYIWVTVLLCVIVAAVMNVAVWLFASSIYSFIVSSKISEEYDAVSYMAKIYDLSSTEERESTLSTLNKEGRTYFITDADGNVIYQNGSNTMGTTSGVFELPGMTDNEDNRVKAYLDLSTEGMVKIDETGELKISPGAIIKFAEIVREQSNLKVELTKYSIDMPLWIAIDVKEGEEAFYGKANFRMSVSDVVYMAMFVAVGVFIIAIVILLMLTNMFTTLADRRRLSKVFFTDPVTRTSNWMWMVYKGELLLKKRKSAGETFAMLDVVFVKYRNFCVCHSVEEGEEMLRRVDRVLRNNITKKDLAAHYASANFAVLLKYNTREELEKRLNKIIAELEKIGDGHRCTFHIGVYPVEKSLDEKGKKVKRKDVDIEREYNNACTARATLEDCDDSGIAYFDEELVEKQKWADIVMEKYEEAIDKEEFVIYYQPKYDPKTSELKGVEALIRWDSPELGFIAPGEFIPILENNGLIPKIDHYMITHVARDQKAWYDAGYECVPASVNVSRAHFIENDLAIQIRDAVDKEGAPHNLIEIEVTESAFFDDKKVMIDTIRQLKEFGFMVSMDDFGSGYSSLNSLKDMPLDVLKLDAEFFRGDMNDNRGEIVISEAIQLAKRLNMITVAEGVELKEQVDFLAGKGCDMIQGYYFASPMPKEEYAERMNREKTPKIEETAETELSL